MQVSFTYLLNTFILNVSLISLCCTFLFDKEPYHFKSLLWFEFFGQHPVGVCCSVLQCVAVCCSMLQCVAGVAVCGSLWQCVASIHVFALISFFGQHSVAVCCSVTVHCSVLQCVASIHVFALLCIFPTNIGLAPTRTWSLRSTKINAYTNMHKYKRTHHFYKYLSHVSVPCNTPTHTATHSNTI